MAILVFRHVPHEGLGSLAGALEAAGLPWEYVDAAEGAAMPASPDAAGYVCLGGPMSANDDAAYLREEMRLIRAAVHAGRPVLGICLGSQLIARALGARVYRNAEREIGWFPVSWTPAGTRDALFQGLAPSETVFHWHGETFDLPDGAEWLARSERCRHQAFRRGSRVYGLQFHLEATPAMIREWCAAGVNHTDVAQLGALPDADAHAAHLAELSALVFGRWAGLVEPRP